MVKKRGASKKIQKKTRLIRIFDEDFAGIHALAGELQARAQKATSVAEAFSFVFDFFKKHKKAAFSKNGRKKSFLTELKTEIKKTEINAEKKDAEKINAERKDPLRLFSLKYKKYLD